MAYKQRGFSAFTKKAPGYLSPQAAGGPGKYFSHNAKVLGDKIKGGLSKLHSITNPTGTTGPRDYVQTIVKRIKKKNEK